VTSNVNIDVDDDVDDDVNNDVDEDDYLLLSKHFVES